MKSRHKTTDKNIEAMMGLLLRTGVILSAGVVLTGGICYLLQEGSAHPHYRIFEGKTSDLKSINSILKGAATFHSLAVIQSGLLILIATPIARVLLSVIRFLMERDYLYVLITLVVLAIISFSIIAWQA